MANKVQRIGLWQERLFLVACSVAILLPLGLLLVLLADVVTDGLGRWSFDFVTSYPSRHAEKAGIWPALIGTLYLISLTALLALPVGVGAAVFLEEYNKAPRLGRLIEINIANLAGVPSVIYGLLGLGLFVRTLGMGRSLLAGAATLALLILPIIIMATREALRTVPGTLRESALALGATQWQVVRQVVLPAAFPGILTGAILSVSRAVGETAPLIVIGALSYVTFLPDSPFAAFTALPIQIFNWVSRPQEAFVVNASAGIVLLLLVMLAMNAFAIVLRNRLQKKT